MNNQIQELDGIKYAFAEHGISPPYGMQRFHYIVRSLVYDKEVSKVLYCKDEVSFRTLIKKWNLQNEDWEYTVI